MESRGCCRGCSPGAGQGCSSLVCRAACDESPGAADALAKVCESCWGPVYSWIRRQGHTVEDAEDLTQSYFTRFLEKRFVTQFRPGASGCFRPFLLVSVRNFVANERDRERARKRGGGRPPLSLDTPRDAGGAAREPADAHTPETHLRRSRSRGRLAGALASLRAEHSGPRRSERFVRLCPHLLDDPDATPYRRIAAEWGTTESAVRVAVHRLRRRLRAILEEQAAPPSRLLPAPGKRRGRRRAGRLLGRVAALVLATVLGASPGGALAQDSDTSSAGPTARMERGRS